jgi:hypothetical protein
MSLDLHATDIDSGVIKHYHLHRRAFMLSVLPAYSR